MFNYKIFLLFISVQSISDGQAQYSGVYSKKLESSSHSTLHDINFCYWSRWIELTFTDDAYYKLLNIFYWKYKN